MGEKVKLPRNYWKLWSATAISSLGNGVSGVAYPWLASSLTRSPFLIALVGLMSSLPWLLFSLPAGVIIDRLDRRKIIVAMDVARGIITAGVAVCVYFSRASFGDIKHPADAFHGSSNTLLILVLILAGFLMGSAEVLGNNASQAFMPEVVPADSLQKANGQMWSAESLTESFIGPPLASILLGVSIFLPFFFDATSFFASAALISLIVTQVKKKPINEVAHKSFVAELREGLTWLFNNRMIKTLALVLGSLNFLSSMVFASYILFVQEVLHASVFIFAILGTAGAAGGILGGALGPKIAAKLGNGTSLSLSLAGIPLLTLGMGFTHSWIVVWILFLLNTLLNVLWNVITVSYRQTLIPSHLLGRVNSGYRFFGWGSMPLGALAGGSMVSISQHFISRESALRLPFYLGGVVGLLIFVLVRQELTTSKMAAALANSKK